MSRFKARVEIDERTDKLVETSVPISFIVKQMQENVKEMLTFSRQSRLLLSALTSVCVLR